MVGEKGKGGMRHQELQRFLSDYFRRQKKVAVIEAFIGKNIDILVYDSDKIIAIEIQLTSKHYLQIKKNYELGCDEVWIVCDSCKVMNTLKKKLKETLDRILFNKTRFYLIKDFIPHRITKAPEQRGIKSRNKIAE